MLTAHYKIMKSVSVSVPPELVFDDLFNQVCFKFGFNKTTLKEMRRTRHPYTELKRVLCWVGLEKLYLKDWQVGHALNTHRTTVIHGRDFIRERFELNDFTPIEREILNYSLEYIKNK